MKRIYKYPIEDGEKIRGKFTRILKISYQDQTYYPYAWIELDDDIGEIEYTFRILSTGIDFESKGFKYFDTLLEPFVWHIYYKEELIDDPW